MRHAEETRQLIAAAAALAMLALVFVLFKLGVLTAFGQMFVAKSTQHFRDVGKAAEKTVVLKTGERIECKKVNDQGEYWGLVRADRKASAVKKDDVKQIVTE